jgi:hypothetical protein
MEVDSEIQAEKKMVSRKRDVSGYVVDETLVKTGSELVWI